MQLLKGSNTNQRKSTPLHKANLYNAPSLRILGSAALKGKPLRVSTLHINISGDHHAMLGEYAAHLWKEKSMTDVMIVVQSLEFQAHKAVLACYSPYFNEVLNKPGFNDIHYLKIPSVTATAFSILLEYIYTGVLRVNCQELCEVYRAARRLGVKGALRRCVELLEVSNEHFQNMVYLYVTARKLDLLDSSARGFKLMVLNFEKLITTKEFLDLEVEQVIELFNSDEIGARSEVIVFMAALKWLDYNYLEREGHIKEIFKCIRFSLMTMEEILACYHPPVLPGLMALPEIRDVLLNATCYITAKSLGQESLFAELASKPRTFLFGGEPTILWDVSVFDPEKYEITKKQNAATKIQALFRGYITRKHLREEILIANYAATVIQSVYRGYCVRKTVKLTKSEMQRKGRSAKNFILRKDSRSGLLKSYAKTTFEIFEPDTAPKQHVIMYSMGAFDANEDEEANALLVFDTMNRNWNLVTRCLAPRHDARMVFLDGYLYIVGKYVEYILYQNMGDDIKGGFNPLDRTESGIMLPLKECHRLHLGSNEWREMPPMKAARSCHAAAAFNGQILVIGGKDESNKILSSIERYNMSVGKWKKFSPSLPEPRMAMGCTTHKGMLWIAGGITDDSNNISMVDSVWGLDNKTCRWTKKVNLQHAVAFPTLISDGESLYCVGGATRPLSYDKDELESIDKVYKLEKGRWTEKIPMPFQCHSVIGCNVGGFSSHTMTYIQSPVCLDLEEGKTEELHAPPSNAAGFIIEASTSWL